MKRMLLAAMLLATPAKAQNLAPTTPVTPTTPVPEMLDGATRGIRPLAPAPADPTAGNARRAAAAPTTQADRDYMSRLAAQLQESITLSQAEQQSTRNAQMQRVSAHIVTSRQKELGMVNKWLARHPG